jgi:chorismate dehydratase
MIEASMIRLGRIGYVNMAPVFYRLEADVDELVGVPTDLNRRLLDGECDLAPISSIEYARNAERLRLLPRLCVSSEGAVDSIQLVSRVPLERVRTVAVTPESATSVVLTKVLLPEAEHVPLGQDADAKLLIGDAALKSAFEDPTPHYDLGRLWLERTGLPMVFAVWACPEPIADGLAELEDALVASVRRARAEPENLAFEAAARYRYPPGFLARYFEKLRYRFGPRERAGLYTFLELARDHDLLETVPELRFVSTKGAAVA